MIINAEPTKIAALVKLGFKRTETYCNQRAMFIKEFTGQYFRKQSGLTGDTPINLLFSTVRAYVPNLVMQNGVNMVTTEILSHKSYAELLGFGLDSLHGQIKIKNKLRALIVDAIFGIGIAETGISATDTLIGFDDGDCDPGQVYTQIVDLDDFCFDPHCTNLSEALFLGRAVTVQRAKLYDIDGLDHDLIKRLPGAFTNTGDKKKVEQLSKQHINLSEMQDVEDYVTICKIWVPEAQSIIYMADPRTTIFDEFLGVTDFYGPDTGPFRFLTLTPPVPKNPLPVAPVGIWFDLHNMANRVFKKLMGQVDAQKDVILHDPALADVVQDIIDGPDLAVIACANPNGIQTVSLGGQNKDNVEMAGQLSLWYNYIAGNPEQMAGVAQSAKTATQSQIMQSNASITLNDMRDLVYDFTANISSDHAWYLHTDPMIEIPKTKRETGKEEIQLWLTPEQRQGDFLEFSFKIQQRSMSRLDPQTRTQRVEYFTTNTLPSAVAAAQMMGQMGRQFNLEKYLTNVATEFDINDVVQEVFFDPEFQERMEIMMKMGPQNAGKAGTNQNSMDQNGQLPMTRPIQGPQQGLNSGAQETAGIGQQNVNPVGGGF